MLAPSQQAITLFFSPISGSATHTTTTTTRVGTVNQLIKSSDSARLLTLKPAVLSTIVRAPIGTSMNQKKRHLSQTTASDTKQTKKDSTGAAARSKGQKQPQPAAKRQKLDPEGERRVKLPLRSNNNNNKLIRSPVDGGLALSGGIRQKDKTASLSATNGKVVEEEQRNTHSEDKQKKVVKRLRLDIRETPEATSADDTPAEDKPANNKKSKDDGKRSLRSHDGGSRSKSELAQYFPNFDEIINPEAKDKELMTHKTRLFITDEPPKTAGSAQFVLPTPTRTRAPSFSISSPQQPSRSPSKLDLTFKKIEIPTVERTENDPLADSFYEVAHRRAERQEKQLRNIERERAQHEKVQLERLQEGLLGPDWLKVMGISGVTEGDRKKWDDAREYFLKEVKCLLDKFARWKEEERRRKLVEVRKRKEAEEEEDEEDDEEDEEESEDEQEKITVESSPDAAAHQLHLESLSASVGVKGKIPRHRKPSKRALETADSPPATPSKRRIKANPVILPPEIPSGPFLSFFAKPHQRAAALDKTRRTGRTRWAFGHPVPDMAEMPFTLPRSMTSEEGRKASARLRRGLRRGRE